MKRNNLKKCTSMLLAFVLMTMLVFTGMPAKKAEAATISGFTLTAASSTTELISAGVITVSGTISNNTSETINNVKLFDVTNGNSIDLGQGVASIEAGGSYSYSATITLDDGRHFNAGAQNNWRVKLRADGTTASGTAGSTETIAVTISKADARASMTLTLSASNGGTPVPANQVVTFTIAIENTGNTPLSDISITDPTLGTIASGVTLGVGESKNITTQYTMLETITVRATATGRSMVGGVAGTQISSASNELTVTKAEAGLTIDIVPDKLDVARGDVVEFKGTISNSGTMDITKITITDIYGVEVMKDVTLKPGESKEFTYQTTIENSEPYKAFITGVGSDNEEISREYELKFNVKLSEDDVRVDMKVTADYPELEEPDTVIFTFEFRNDRTEPIDMPMVVRQVGGSTLFSLVILSPGTTTQEFEMKIEESSTLRFELVVTTAEGAELIAGAAACSITVADQPIVDDTLKVEEEKSLGWLWVLLSIVAFLLVAAGVVFFILIAQEKKNKAKRGGDTMPQYAADDGYGYGGYAADDDFDDDLYGYSSDTYNTGSYSTDAYNTGSYNTGSYSTDAYTGTYHTDSYTGSQFADSLFNDSQIGAIQHQRPQLGTGEYSGFSSGSSMSYGYDLSSQDSFEQYGGTPRSEFQGGNTVYQGQSYDDDDLFSDLLGDDWSAK